MSDGFLSGFMVTNAATLPFILSGNMAIAFALNGVTRCLASTLFKSLLIATATFILSAENG